MEAIVNRIRRFTQERDWNQFHTPENLAKSIVIEGAELLEHFQWDHTYDKDQVSEELADVMTYCFMLADALEVSIEEIIQNKMDINELKYPVEKAKGNSKKYTELL